LKIRTGFVSNSSSSSFVAYGYLLSKDDYNDRKSLLKLFKTEILDELMEKITGSKLLDISKDDDDYYDDLFYDLQSNNLIICDDPENGAPDDKHCFVGFVINSTDESGGCWDEENAFVNVSAFNTLLNKYIDPDEVGGADPGLLTSSKLC